jgi:hypothetical protein
MPTIFDCIYREYCRARLAEMRKQLFLVSAQSDEACDANHPGDAGENGGFDWRAAEVRDLAEAQRLRHGMGLRHWLAAAQ